MIINPLGKFPEAKTDSMKDLLPPDLLMEPEKKSSEGLRKLLEDTLPVFAKHPYLFGSIAFALFYVFTRFLLLSFGDPLHWLPATPGQALLLFSQYVFILFVFRLLASAIKQSDKTSASKLEEGLRRTQQIQKISIMGFAKISEVRDQSTGNHITRMGYHAKVIAEEMGRHPKFAGYVTERYCEDILLSAPLHDIGKVGISDNILKKAGSLTMNEFEMMKMHTIIGGDLMSELERKLPFKSFYTLGKEIAYHHHQKYDGTGYPNVLSVGGSYAFFVQEGVGRPLKGDEIPLSARIVAVADVYDALVSRRCYKEPLTHEMAKQMILEESGSHFDPEVVAAFVRAEQRIMEVAEHYKD